jgi:hypothetical protein
MPVVYGHEPSSGGHQLYPRLKLTQSFLRPADFSSPEGEAEKGFTLSLKIVIAVKGKDIEAITAYPLKKRKNNESIL